MHLVGPYLTTTKYAGKGKKPADTAKLRKAAVDHEEFLRKQGLHKDQLDQRKKNFKKSKVRPLSEGLPEMPALSNNLHVNGGFQNTMMTHLHKESKEVQQEILNKASRLIPLYNKGPVQYVSPGEDLKTLGSKSKK